MADFRLRPAAASDSPAIKDLIHRVAINPMDLDWHRFVLAVDSSGRLLGCGQLKPHGRDVIELASIAVEPSHRGQGVARAVIEHLLAAGPRPLYLTCRSRLGRFYEKWGFQALAADDMPPYFRRLARLAGVFGRLMDDRLLVMTLK